MLETVLSCGIGLRQPHYREVMTTRPSLDFVEVHTENFFNRHDAASQVLATVRTEYPVSLHGVGLALGSACGLDDAHLDRVAALAGRIDPVRISDHASFARAPWAQAGIVHANDLLPVAFTEATMEIFCANIQRVQERLRRPILIENLSAYLDFAQRDYSEPEFFAELGRRSGCGMLLDINNLIVNALNAAAPDPVLSVCDWIDELHRLAPAGLIGEIHLAGFSTQQELIIDDHASPVSDPVWQAYAYALKRFGALSTLIEWDDQLPALSVLLGEAAKAIAVSERAIAAGNACHLSPPPRKACL